METIVLPLAEMTNISCTVEEGEKGRGRQGGRRKREEGGSKRGRRRGRERENGGGGGRGRMWGREEGRERRERGGREEGERREREVKNGGRGINKWRSDGTCTSLASAYLSISGNMLTSIHRTQQSR